MPDSQFDDLALRVLHELADDDERAELVRLLASSPESRRCFLHHAVLHGMLASEAKAGSLAQNPLVFFDNLEKKPVRKVNHPLKIWLPAAAAIVVAGIAAVIFRPSNAMAALDRVIVAMNEARDRSYTIEVGDAGADTESQRTDRGRFPPSNHLDGATLWLRGPGEFVLSQSLPNGETRLIGGDTNQSWSMRGSGPVRVSSEPKRFSRAIFEPNGEFAFLDLRTQLEQLRQTYRIEWLDRSSQDVLKLRGLRHSKKGGGPGEIEIWFNPNTGLITRLFLRQLPREKGGPSSITIILRSAEPLPRDFFQHTRHHEPGRPVLTES